MYEVQGLLWDLITQAAFEGGLNHIFCVWMRICPRECLVYWNPLRNNKKEVHQQAEAIKCHLISISFTVVQIMCFDTLACRGRGSRWFLNTICFKWLKWYSKRPLTHKSFHFLSTSKEELSELVQNAEWNSKSSVPSYRFGIKYKTSSYFCHCEKHQFLVVWTNSSNWFVCLHSEKKTFLTAKMTDFTSALNSSQRKPFQKISTF